MYFIFFTAFILILIWLFQYFFLERYYQSAKIRDITDAANQIIQAYGTDEQEVTNRSLAFDNSLCIVITDEMGNPLVMENNMGAYSHLNKVINKGYGIGLFKMISKLKQSDDNYITKIAQNENFKSKEIFYCTSIYTDDFYRDKMLCLTAKPNKAHYKLAEMERAGILSSVITQNIDGLHTAAGSKKVLELHGSVHRNYCMDCGKFYTAEDILNSTGIPKCTCGGTIKPDVVLYEEGLDDKTVTEAVREISQCDTLIIAGTSLTVYPAAGMVRYFQGDNLVLINRDKTSMDGSCDLVIHDKVGETLDKIVIK